MQRDEIISLRNDLVDILEAIPSLVSRRWKPPIIDASKDSTELEAGSESIAGLGQFESSVAKEIDTLDKALDDATNTKSQLSTNAPYFVSVWREIASASALIAVGRSYNIDVSKFPDLKDEKPSRNRTAKVQKRVMKIDVVADEGRSWVRVNTIKNSRLRSELNEIDAYADEDLDSDEENEHINESDSTVSWDNSVIRMAKSMLAAAQCNPVPGTSITPKVTLRLTRLQPPPATSSSPSAKDRTDFDPRIQQTVDIVRGMGIEVLLGEKDVPLQIPKLADKPSSSSNIPLRITTHLNLDLSLLVAMVSDLTHTPVPVDELASVLRYTPLIKTWQRNLEAMRADSQATDESTVVIPTSESSNATSSPHPEQDMSKVNFNPHSRALSSQADSERRLGLFSELHNRLILAKSGDSTEGDPEFECWTTPEAAHRLSGIISKIGGRSETQRAQSLFLESREEAERLFWEGSRFPKAYVKGLVPVKIYPTKLPTIIDNPAMTTFQAHIAQACRSILAYMSPRGESTTGNSTSTHAPAHVAVKASKRPASGSPRDFPAHSPSLTPHTVTSLLWGASNGMTTLTANRTSIRALLREIRMVSKGQSFYTGSNVEGQSGGTIEGVEDEVGEGLPPYAAIWIVEPRSLAEAMRTDTGEGENAELTS